MKQTEQAETFEQVLLSYADLCYSVALALTRDPHDARDLARKVMIWAWHLRGNAGAETNIKMRLLTALRKEFLQHYRKDQRQNVLATQP
jgi:DNA-directed RNA polymerase specialized sigma24 family protein